MIISLTYCSRSCFFNLTPCVVPVHVSFLTKHLPSRARFNQLKTRQLQSHERWHYQACALDVPGGAGFGRRVRHHDIRVFRHWPEPDQGGHQAARCPGRPERRAGPGDVQRDRWGWWRTCIKLKLNRAFVSTKSANSALHRAPDRPFQPLYFSQLPREHNRGAVITNDASL